MYAAIREYRLVATTLVQSLVRVLVALTVLVVCFSDSEEEFSASERYLTFFLFYAFMS